MQEQEAADSFSILLLCWSIARLLAKDKESGMQIHLLALNIIHTKQSLTFCNSFLSFKIVVRLEVKL